MTSLDAIKKQTAQWLQQISPPPSDDGRDLLAWVPMDDLDNLAALLLIVEKRGGHMSNEEMARMSGVMAAARYRRESGQEPFGSHSQPYRPRNMQYK